jgi:predicted membrane metal-binding protein
MKRLKQIFIFPFLLGIVIALGHAIFALTTGQVSPAWWSVIIYCGAMFGFMAYLGLAGVTATSQNMPIQVS